MNFVEFQENVGEVRQSGSWQDPRSQSCCAKLIDVLITLTEAVSGQSIGDWERGQAADLTEPQGSSG